MQEFQNELTQLECSCGHMQLWVTRDIHCFLGYPVASMGINGFSLVCACVNFRNSPTICMELIWWGLKSRWRSAWDHSYWTILWVDTRDPKKLWLPQCEKSVPNAHTGPRLPQKRTMPLRIPAAVHCDYRCTWINVSLFVLQRDPEKQVRTK